MVYVYTCSPSLPQISGFETPLTIILFKVSFICFASFTRSDSTYEFFSVGLNSAIIITHFLLPEVIQKTRFEFNLIVH